MSLMSAADAGQADSAGGRFLVPVPTPGTGPRPRYPVRLTSTGRTGPAESEPAATGRAARITELRFRELQVRHVSTHGYRDRQLHMVHARAARPAAVRLTRRGRLVVTVFALLIAGAAATALWLSTAGGAQAASHGQPARAGYLGMTKVVVEPGQTLWSIASAAEPAANIQTVVQQIINANALGGSTIHAGEALWVPRA